MGNIIDTLVRYVFDRRQNPDITSHPRTDHPEIIPLDKSPTIKNLRKKPKLSSTTMESVGITVTGAEETSLVEMRTTLIREADSESIATISMEVGEMMTISEMTSIPRATTTEPLPSSNKCSDFYVACRSNNLEEVRNLLETITLDEIDRLEPNGSTALHSACYHGHEEIVALLLKAGADRAILNKFKCLPFDEAKNDKIKSLFLRIPNTNRLVSDTGAIEWELVNDDVLETAAEERHIIKSLYNNTSGFTAVGKMFEKIQKNYIYNGLDHFDGIKKIKRFFRKATEEQDPRWIIKAYTAETDFYKVLNTEIACGASKYQNERRYIIALLWHHPKLDELAYIGRSYRVMQLTYNDLQRYEINCLLMTKSFLSSSIDQKIAELFLFRKEEKQFKEPTRTRLDGTFIKLWVMCVYHIKHRRTALHIENSSQYANEGEILIMPYTVFKVKRIGHIQPSSLPTDQTMTEIEFEECDHFFNT
jgi:hypothetical protein